MIAATMMSGHPVPLAIEVAKPTTPIVTAFGTAAVFAILWAYRSGDSDMRSVWICSRNDVIGNLAVLLAALGVFGTADFGGARRSS